MSLSNSRRPLGRGLAALIPQDVMESSAPRAAGRGTLRTVAITSVSPNPEQPRARFGADALRDLTASIREHGILSPLVVRQVVGGRYVLIAGERRLRAAGLAGLKDVPVLVRSDADDRARQLELALVENLQRADLDPIEAALGYQRLIEEYGFTQDEVARKIGKNRATVANAVRILRLPDTVLSRVRDRQLSAGHARALLPALDDPEVLNAIVSQVLVRELSVRATERLVKEKTKVRRTLEARQKKDAVLHYADELLTRSLGTRVQIKARAKGDGRIVIDFHSGEELERLIQLLRED